MKRGKWKKQWKQEITITQLIPLFIFQSITSKICFTQLLQSIEVCYIFTYYFSFDKNLYTCGTVNFQLYRRSTPCDTTFDTIYDSSTTTDEIQLSLTKAKSRLIQFPSLEGTNLLDLSYSQPSWLLNSSP